MMEFDSLAISFLGGQPIGFAKAATGADRIGMAILPDAFHAAGLAERGNKGVSLRRAFWLEVIGGLVHGDADSTVVCSSLPGIYSTNLVAESFY